MSTGERILIVAGDTGVLRVLSEALGHPGRRITQAQDRDEATRLLGRGPPHLIVLDETPADEAIAWIQWVQQRTSGVDVILLTADSGMEVFVNCRAAGVWDVLASPPPIAALRELAADVFQARQAREGAIELGHVDSRLRLVGRSPAMRKVKREIAAAAGCAARVLLLGETGTGKERAALTIHDLSRPGRPYEAINFGATDPTLASSTIFGHKKGAFTGAIDDHRGLLECAGEGTVLFDEIGDATLDLQVKLLRVLEEGTFRPLKGGEDVQFRARVVAATHRNLEERVQAGTFREDLLFRLKQVVIYIPPLRQRPEDIWHLFVYFLSRYVQQNGLPLSSSPLVAREVREALHEHSWPGNGRELKHIAEGAFRRARGGVIRAKDLGLGRTLPRPQGGEPGAEGSREVIEHGRAGAAAASADRRPASEPFTSEEGRFMTAKEVEAAHIRGALRLARGVVAEAARMLGVARSSLYDRMEVLGIPRPKREEKTD